MVRYSVENTQDIVERALLLRPSLAPLFQDHLMKQMPGGSGAAGAGPDPNATYSIGELLRTIATTPGLSKRGVEVASTVTPEGEEGPGLKNPLPLPLYVAWAAGAEMTDRHIGGDDVESREDVKNTLIELMPDKDAKELVRAGNWISGVYFVSMRGGTRRRRRRTTRRLLRNLKRFKN